MVKVCIQCGKKMGSFDAWREVEQGKFMCLACYKTEKGKELEEAITKAPKIQCPYCKQWFPKLTKEQYQESAELNVLKWLIVPAWGVVGALKNKPFIECPHCKMKIMQG